MSNLLAGLVQGYAQGQQQRLQQEEAKEMRKLQVKMFQRQLDMEDEKKAAQKKLMDLLSGGQELPNFSPNDDEGNPLPVAVTPSRSLKDVLGSPEGQSAALGAGYNINDIRQFQNPGVAEVMARLQMPPVPGGSGGLELSGVKIGPDGQVMPDFVRPRVKSEVPSPDGLTMIQMDEFGRRLGIRPAGPGEIKPRERSAGQTSVDRKFADEYVDFTAVGGFATMEKGLNQLAEVSSALQDGGITGPALGSTPDYVRRFVSPKSIAIRDQAHEVIQANLRLVLGPQFTQKEGEGVMARAFDQTQSDAENKKRIDRLMKQMQEAMDAKKSAAEFFEKNGTLSGWNGKLWTAGDFLRDSKTPSKPSLSGPGSKVVDFNSLPK